jgi:hypothetical protein
VFSFIDSLGLKDLGHRHRPKPLYVGWLAQADHAEIAAKSETVDRTIVLASLG